MKAMNTDIAGILHKQFISVAFIVMSLVCAAVDIPLPPGTARSMRDIGRDTTIVTNIYAMYKPQSSVVQLTETATDSIGTFIATPGCMNYFNAPTAAELVEADLDYIEVKALSDARTFDLFIGKEYEPLIYWERTNMPITVKSDCLSINGKTNYVTAVTNVPVIVHFTQFPNNAVRMMLEYVDYSESEPYVEKVIGTSDNVVTNGCSFKVIGKNFDDVDRVLVTYVTNDVQCTSAAISFTKNKDFTEIAAS